MNPQKKMIEELESTSIRIDSPSSNTKSLYMCRYGKPTKTNSNEYCRKTDRRLTRLQLAFKEQFLFTFDMYEKLFSTLHTKGLFFRAEKLRHHLIFYLGHTAVFYINKLVTGKFLEENDRINPHFESIFAVGVDEMSWDDILTENYDWCGLLEDEKGMEKYANRVWEYRKLVKNKILDMIENDDGGFWYTMEDAILPNEGDNNAAGPCKIDQDSIYWIFLMGVEHEKIHLETSCCIISQMPLELINYDNAFKFPIYGETIADLENDITTMQKKSVNDDGEKIQALVHCDKLSTTKGDTIPTDGDVTTEESTDFRTSDDSSDKSTSETPTPRSGKTARSEKNS